MTNIGHRCQIFVQNLANSMAKRLQICENIEFGEKCTNLFRMNNAAKCVFTCKNRLRRSLERNPSKVVFLHVDISSKIYPPYGFDFRRVAVPCKVILAAARTPDGTDVGSGLRSTDRVLLLLLIICGTAILYSCCPHSEQPNNW